MKTINKSGKYSWLLNKQGQEEEITGVFVAKKGEKVVVVTDMIFDQANTKGRVHVKGVVYAGGYLEFRGKIKITKNGTGADGYLKQEILKLGENATAIAVPDLEIETNEVKASHAASVAGIDSEQLFYMMSRGLTKTLAEQEIVEAFLQ